MFSRRLILGALASASAFAVSGVALAKKKNHHNGRALLGSKIKKNGKHALHKAGKVNVSADVSNGKVVAVEATNAGKGNLSVGKVKSREKLAEAPALILTGGPGTQYAQTTDWHYGYWFNDGVDDWYYWFTADDVIVDETWVVYGGGS